jgi:integrase
MGLYRRGKIFWFTIMQNGKRIQVSTKTDNKKLAERIYSKAIYDIQEDRWFETQRLRRITFDEMVEKYLNNYAKQRDPYTAKILLSFFTGYKLFQITTALIAEYRNMRLKVVKPATVYQELSLMRRMFNVAIKEWEWIRDNPVSRLSFSVGNRNARDRWLTPEEEEKLLNSATNPKWLRSLIVFALHTGMRRGEILNLMWKDVDFKRKTVTVVRSKNNVKRVIPMSKTLYDTLKNIERVVDISGRVFPISVDSLKDTFSNAIIKAGIKDFHFHDLRHTFATRLVQNGVDLYKVKELLGHKTISMTTRYAHHYPESLRSSVEVLDNCYNFATIKVKDV